jgi:hypothetical protein
MVVNGENLNFWLLFFKNHIVAVIESLAVEHRVHKNRVLAKVNIDIVIA